MYPKLMLRRNKNENSVTVERCVDGQQFSAIVPPAKRHAAVAVEIFVPRSQALVNDDLLIDFPPDTYWHSIAHGG